MLEEHAPGETPPNDLALQALLYASGELDEPDAALFERRLGEDQEAREALLQAVQNNLTALGQPAVAPDPEYRDRVRQRLRQRKRLLRSQRQPSAFGPVALWMVLGAIGAVLLMLVLSHMAALHHEQSAPTSKPAGKSADAPLPDELLLPKLTADRQALQEQAERAAGRWAALPEDSADRAMLEAELRAKAQELVTLDIAILELRVKQLGNDLEALNRELATLRADGQAQRRYEAILGQAKSK
jgi:hypothetical protein